MDAGVLTFLFSDIEASTRRWEADAQAMSAALARHDGIVRSAIEAAGGEVFKHTGDGVCAVFSAARAGVVAALAVQKALQAEDWGDAGQLRVRIAVHSGTAEHRHGDYFGPTLNRVARLMATAHGGQIIASQTTAELSRAALPVGASLTDLGEHRLADLSQPEHVFQIGAPELPAEFPPLRSLDWHRHNLPIAPTPFIGRERELAEIEARLGRGRLVTLVGLGGAGKTRMALETAGRVLESYPDGVFFVDLAPLSAPDLVAQAVVSAVGFVIDRLGPGPGAVLDRLAEYLTDRRVLIVLDNCEHVVEAAAVVADTLLRRCAGVTLLATSRELVGVPGEEVWRIPSLSLPSDDDAGLDEVTSADAVAFFCDRAWSADPGFRLTGPNVTAVAQICRRLDGIPLALELAAARLRLLSPTELAARLDDRFRLLTAGSRTVLERHRTLRAAIDWGYELLSPAERVVLGRLSVFAGGFDLESAEAVVPEEDTIASGEVVDILGGLVDRSWIAVEPGGGGRTRYRLLETIRQYAAEKLGKADDVRRRHAEHFGGMAMLPADQPLFPPPSWMDKVDADLDNVRAALEWWFAAGAIESCLHMTAGLSRFWGLSGRVAEGRMWLERVLAAAPTSPSVGLVGALNGMGFLLFQAGEPPALAGSFYEKARVAAQAIGDVAGESVATGLLGFRALQRGELDEAERLMKQAIDGFTETDSSEAVGWSEWALSCLVIARGDYEAATAHLERMLAVARRKDDSDLLAHALAGLSSLNAQAGKAHAAQSCADEAIEVARRLPVRDVLIMALTRAAEAMFLLGDSAGAALRLEESLSMLHNMDGLSWVAYSLELSALIVVKHDRLGQGARLLGAVRALDAVSQEVPESRPLHEEVKGCLAMLESALGPEVVIADLDAGAALPVKEAITLALAELRAACLV